MEFFVCGLSPPGLKQKAHQFLIENPPATWQQLKDHIATKDLSFAISSEFTGTASSSVDNKLEIEGIKDQLKELTGLRKYHKINAAYNPHEHRNKQNNPMFCNWCCMSGHTIRHCFKYIDQQEQNYDSLQLGENSNRSYHNYSKSRSRVDNKFNKNSGICQISRKVLNRVTGRTVKNPSTQITIIFYLNRSTTLVMMTFQETILIMSVNLLI